MIKIKDLVATNGNYKNKDGEEKARWINIGALFQDGNKLSIKLESIPVGGNWNGWVSCVDPKPVDGSERRLPKKFDGFEDMPNDIPF